MVKWIEKLEEGQLKMIDESLRQEMFLIWTFAKWVILGYSFIKYNIFILCVYLVIDIINIGLLAKYVIYIYIYIYIYVCVCVCVCVCAHMYTYKYIYVGVHKSTSLMSLSLLLQQCPACMVRLTWIVFVIGGRWPYSWCLVGCCRQDLFKIARSILV